MAAWHASGNGGSSEENRPKNKWRQQNSGSVMKKTGIGESHQQRHLAWRQAASMAGAWHQASISLWRRGMAGERSGGGGIAHRQASARTAESGHGAGRRHCWHAAGGKSSGYKHQAGMDRRRSEAKPLTVAFDGCDVPLVNCGCCGMLAGEAFPFGVDRQTSWLAAALYADLAANMVL
jgi:hypothetical protein